MSVSTALRKALVIKVRLYPEMDEVYEKFKEIPLGRRSAEATFLLREACKAAAQGTMRGGRPQQSAKAAETTPMPPAATLPPQPTDDNVGNLMAVNGL